MYCSNCGTQIPDDSKFCTACGTAVAVVHAAPKAQPAPAAQPQPVVQPQPAARPEPAAKTKTEKKRAPAWVSILVIVAAFLLGKYVIAPSMLSEPEQDQNDYSQQQMQDDQNSNVNITPSVGAYDEIFLNRGIVDMPTMFTTQGSAAFVVETDNNGIEKLEFGYNGDTVIEMVDTFYYPITELSEAERTELDKSMQDSLSGVANLEFCTATYHMGNLYYKVTLHFTGLDNADNVRKMCEFGLLDISDATFMSIAKTESNLLAQGFVKK